MNENTVIQWLLEDTEPVVKYRTQTELLDIKKGSEEEKLTHKARL